MSNNKQSSVEWFSQESWKLKVKLENQEITIGEYAVTYVDLLKQAKSKHEDEIKDAWDKGDYCIDLPDGTWEQKYKSSEHYYNETFGGNNEQQ